MSIIFKLINKNIPLAPFFPHRGGYAKGELVLFILFCCLTFALNSQSITQLELKFQNLNQLLDKEQAIYDSLNTFHNNMISVIDKEKQKDESEKENIINLLASTVVISNQVKEQQIKIDKIEDELEAIKKTLSKKYATVIDSLKTLENSSEYSGDKEFLKFQILNSIEKRLLVAPKIYSLSFDPKKLIQYKTSAKMDTLEQKIYREYLSNALVEVDIQSQQLALLKDEIEEVVHLQNETYDFIEDIDSEMLFNPALQTSKTSTRNDNVYLGGNPNRIDDEISNIFSQANSYLHIFNLLKTSTNIDAQSSWLTPTDTIPANLTFKQYLDLLEDIDKMLQDYRTVLEHKLESH